MNKLKNLYAIVLMAFFIPLLTPLKTHAQANFGSRAPIVLNLVTDFGATVNDGTDDSYALIKASKYIENKWHKNGDTLVTGVDTPNINYSLYYVRLEIPGGTYDVGKEINLTVPPYNNLYVNANVNPGTQQLKYSTLYNDTANNNEGITIVADYSVCAGKWVSKRYVSAGLFSVNGPMNNPIDGIEIVGTGTPGPLFKYADSVHVGWIDTLGNATIFYDSNANVSWNYGQCGYYWNQYHSSNHLFNFDFCKNVKISHIAIDGNNRMAFYMGYGIDRYQGGAMGIRLNAKNVTVQHVDIHHMQVDGLNLADRACGSKTNFVADSISSEYNGRQGFTWAVGDSVAVRNSVFNHTGRAASLVQPNAHIASTPNAGLDIEYGGECAVNGSEKYILKNGFFYNCQFLNNAGPSMTNDYGGSKPVRSKDIQFRKCTFQKTDGYGLLCEGMNFSYDSCNIYCAVVHGYWEDSVNGESKFTNCDFEDKPYNGTGWSTSDKLLEYNGIKKTLFQNCTFQVNDSLREFFLLNWYANLNKTDWTVIDGCTFIYNNKGKTATDKASLMRGVRFKNRNQVKNVLNSNNSYHLFITRQAIIEGNNTGCVPASLAFSGQVEHAMMSSNLGVTDTLHIGKKADGSDGFATYETGDRALSYIEAGTHVKIGNFSAMRILRGGSMLSYNKFYFGGQLTSDAGSYVVFNPSTTHYYSTPTNPYDLLYIDSLTNYNQTTTSPIWTNGEGYAAGTIINNYEPAWFGYYNAVDTPPCIQGNHAQLNNALSCTPINYSHIKTHGVKSLMYNLRMSCADAGTIDTFQFMVQGGIRPYTYKLNGSVITDTNLNGNAIAAAGIYTLSVEDATGCKDTFYVEMDTALTYKIIRGCRTTTTPAMFKTNTCSPPVVTGPVGAIINYTGNDTVTVSIAGNYTITAGGKSTPLYIGDCANCSTAALTAEWKAPNLSVTSLFPDGILPLNNVVLQGTIDVDSLLIFNNQPDIYCTANTKLIMTDSNTFVCNRTTMRGCTEYWNGIVADGFGKTVIVNSNSTLQDMKDGVQIKNNAFLQARNSSYLNNLNQSIRFDNIKAPQYRSAIEGNTFKSNGNLLSYSGNSYCSALVGVYAFNSTDIEIGDSTGKGNTFDSLKVGVLVSGDVNIGLILTDSTSRIGIYNNTFRHITDCGMTATYAENNKINSCYGWYYGAGIFANYGMVPSSFDARVDIRNAYDTNTVIRFENCDKAIVTKNAMVTAKNLYLDNNLMGIMCNGLTAKTVKVEHNYVKNGIIGMQFIGNNTDSYVRNNTIDSLTGYQKGVADYGWGTGIDVRHYTNADTSILEVKDNNITVSGFAGRGINLENTGRNVNVMKNDINLTRDETNVIVCAGATLLNGINATNIYHSLMYKNQVTGNDSINMTEREDATGILINNSSIPRVECNIAERTRFGITAISECLTDTNGVRGNTTHEQVLGWAFRHLGTEGTFGNVGTLYSDNHNLWTGNTQLYKVFKFCEGMLGHKIYTNPIFLTLFESNSENITTQVSNDCPYAVQNNTGATVYTCPVNFNFQQPFNVNSSGVFPHTEAIKIATHTKSYSEYPEIAYWMDARKLYHDLDNSYTYRYSNDTLLAFYDSLHTAVMAHIDATEDNIALMIQGMASMDYELYKQRMSDAKESNSNVVSDEDQENNEYDMNEIFLKMLAYGIDSLDSEDSTRIAELAHLCPYIGGTAVYKARALYAMYNPANMFDDIAICNPIGVYKNGNNGNSKDLFDGENAYLQSLKPKANILSQYGEHPFLLYPNPASTSVTIAYELGKTEKGVVIIYDILGREQLKIDLHPGNNKMSINVSLLKQGIYTYQYIVNNLHRYAGKLLIE